MKLIFVAGTGPGMGKMTLAGQLATALGGQHIEDAGVIFERPEFAPVAARFRSGVHPGPLELKRAWRALVRSIKRAPAVVVLDGSFIDGAEDLDWALASEEALHTFSRDMRVILSPVDPLLFFLDGDIAEGIRRRAAQYGREWFRHHVRPDEPWEVSFARIEASFTARRLRLRRAFDAGDWRLCFLDASLSSDQMLDTALKVVSRTVSS